MLPKSVTTSTPICDGDLVDDIDDDCHSNATCSDDGGGYVCTCEDGFEGDGIDECKEDLFDPYFRKF